MYASTLYGTFPGAPDQTPAGPDPAGEVSPPATPVTATPHVKAPPLSLAGVWTNPTSWLVLCIGLALAAGHYAATGSILPK